MDVVEAFQKVRDLASELQKPVRQVTEICSEGNTTRDGISLLQVKHATLMRYNLNLIKLAKARVKGEPIEAIATKLVEDFVALSKLRPIEKKLQYQIDTLLKGAASRASGKADPADRHRPDPSAIVIDEEDGHNTDEEGEQLYRPPRIAEVVYDDRDEKRKLQDQKQKERYKARAARNEDVREMIAHVKGRPDELRDDDGAATSSKAVQKLMHEDEERRRFEEDNFVRLNVTKKDKKRRRDLERVMEGPTLDGTDEYSSLMAVADRVMTPKIDRSKLRQNVDDDEEEVKMQQLDEITEQMYSAPRRSSGKSTRKQRKR